MQKSLVDRRIVPFQSRIDKVMERYSQEQKQKEFTIAAEIYLAKMFTEIYYKDLMRNVNTKELVSSTQLLCWLDDDTRSGREGFLTRYIGGAGRIHNHIRSNGTWLASYLPEAMEMFYHLTQSKEFISRTSIRNDFRLSFNNEKWVLSATAITGLKMLEAQDRKGLLLSPVASEIIRQNVRMRESIGSYANIVGRVLKNNNMLGPEIIDSIREIFKEHHRGMMRNIEMANHPDYILFKEIGVVFHSQIVSLPESIHGEKITGDDLKNEFNQTGNCID